MTPRQTIDSANNISDEDYEIDALLDYFNTAISAVNVEWPAMFPAIGDPQVDANLSEGLQRAYVDLDTNYEIHNTDLIVVPYKAEAVNSAFLNSVIKPYVLYLIKTREDEPEQAGRWYGVYVNNLNNFMRSYRNVIDSNFIIEVDEEIYGMDSAFQSADLKEVATGDYNFGDDFWN